MRVDELVSGRGNDYAEGLTTLADICLSERDFESGLKHIQEARYILATDGFALLGMVLNMEALLLERLERYQEALLMREKQKEYCLQSIGPNHPNFANTLSSTASLHARLDQMQSAVDLASEAIVIYMKTLGPSHPSTQGARERLAEYQEALTDPDLKNELASKSDRMCN